MTVHACPPSLRVPDVRAEDWSDLRWPAARLTQSCSALSLGVRSATHNRITASSLSPEWQALGQEVFESFLTWFGYFEQLRLSTDTTAQVRRAPKRAHASVWSLLGNLSSAEDLKKLCYIYSSVSLPDQY